MVSAQVYVVKGGRIKPANKRFNTLNNDYEITFDESTTVTESQDSSKVPQQKV
jgi:replication factor A1